ncbi:hypothetical protein MFIFM68171_02286 [Madurella fahalii]|uniref:Ankyrin repeat protein n=1 Tax=Madurella fahalii TaxID=1157608 RepID=A0ABQ0G2V1_9PEZI
MAIDKTGYGYTVPLRFDCRRGFVDVANLLLEARDILGLRYDGYSCGGSDTERGLELSCPKSLQAPEHRRARLYRAVRESCRLGRNQPVQKVLRSLSSDPPLALWQELFSIANASTYADAVGETIENPELAVESFATWVESASETGVCEQAFGHRSSAKYIRFLASKGAEDMNSRTALSSTPILLAVEAQSVEALEAALIQAGADANAPGNDNLYPIQAASYGAEIARLLISSGADVDKRFDNMPPSLDTVDSRGRTVLVLAMHVADPSVLLRLIELSALVEVDGRAFDGLLAVACLHRPREVVQALRNSGIAECTNVDQVGSSPEALTPGAIIGAPLHLARLKSTPETIEMLIRYGAALDSTDHGGRTPLYFAFYRTLEHVRLLLAGPDSGTGLNAVDSLGRSVLHSAVLSGRLDLVRFVLEKRPELVDPEDIHGWTPLLWALRVMGLWGSETCERADILHELLGRGARRLICGPSPGQ